jgi:hypothetical protein
MTGCDMDVYIFFMCLRLPPKLHLHDISHVSLPRLVSALGYMLGLNMMNANEIQKNASLDTQPQVLIIGYRWKIPIVSINPAPSFTRSTLCDVARWVVCFGRSR